MPEYIVYYESEFGLCEVTVTAENEREAGRKAIAECPECEDCVIEIQPN